MYTLINIIIYLNMQNVPHVNVVTNFKNLDVCEEKFQENLDRIKGNNKKGSIKIYQEEKRLLALFKQNQ